MIKGTRDTQIGNILQARTINHALGGAVVGPGDIDSLQDDFIDACNAIELDLPAQQRRLNGHK